MPDVVTFPYSADYLRAIDGRLACELTLEVRLLRAVSLPPSRRALQQALGLRDDEHFPTLYLLPALEGGLVEMTIPEKPTSRLQKYRITEAGRARLQAAEKKAGLR